MNFKKNQRFRFLIVSDVSISSIIGGAERVLFEQSTRLAKKGHSVHILTRKSDEHEEYKQTIKGVTEWRYDYSPKNPISFLLSTLRNAKRLFEIIHDRYSFDCLNFHQPFSTAGVLSSSLSRKMAKIYTCHSLSFEEFLSRKVRKISIFEKPEILFNTKARRWIEKKGLESSDEIIALSKFTKSKIVSSYKIDPQNISIISGGVDLLRFRYTENSPKIRKVLGIPKNKIVLFTVRNLVNRMGLKNLIFAIKNIISNAPDIYLVIGGDGPLKLDLIALTKRLNLDDFIHFAGFIPEDQLPSYYQMANLFVLPTKELEGFGLVTLEAMASGLPVIGTPVGGTKEILGKFDSKLLFKDTDSNSMATLILENYYLIKQNSEKWKEISIQCRKFVEQNYSWDKNIDSLEKIFLRLSRS